jgi:hypothetical protein
MFQINSIGKSKAAMSEIIVHAAKINRRVVQNENITWLQELPNGTLNLSRKVEYYKCGRRYHKIQ